MVSSHAPTSARANADVGPIDAGSRRINQRETSMRFVCGTDSREHIRRRDASARRFTTSGHTSLVHRNHVRPVRAHESVRREAVANAVTCEHRRWPTNSRAIDAPRRGSIRDRSGTKRPPPPSCARSPTRVRGVSVMWRSRSSLGLPCCSAGRVPPRTARNNRLTQSEDAFQLGKPLALATPRPSVARPTARSGSVTLRAATSRVGRTRWS